MSIVTIKITLSYYSTINYSKIYNIALFNNLFIFKPYVNT